MARFVIDLGDVEMSKDAQAQLNTQLQQTALAAVAGIKVDKPLVVRFPWEWLGIILRRDIDGIFEADKVISRSLYDMR